ncbi:MAG TPA: acyltransferase [Stellaceae bacterium]|nr:acyltransferase [Stellaceae bacterium]
MTEPVSLSSAQRFYLDLVRASAAMMVLFGHAAHFFWPQSFMARGWLQGLGVYLFFLISGFLISFSVFEKRDDPNYGFRSYFIDRLCRIYSAFLPALIFVALLDALSVDSPFYAWRRDYNLQTWIGNLFMLQDFPAFQVLRRLGVPDNQWFIAPFGTARPFWTISIEWWIYMLFGGIVLVWLRRGRLGRGAMLALGFAAIEPAYHFVGGYDECLTLLWIAGMGASLLFWNLPALARRWPALDGRRLHRAALIVAAAAAVSIIGRLFSNRSELLEFQIGLFIGVLLFALLIALGFVQNRIPRIVVRLVGFIAGYSYSLYLTHHTLLEFLAIRFGDRHGSAAMFWLVVIAANGLAMVFWVLFERHYKRLARSLKDRLARREPVLSRPRLTAI